MPLCGGSHDWGCSVPGQEEGTASAVAHDGSHKGGCNFGFIDEFVKHAGGSGFYVRDHGWA